MMLLFIITRSPFPSHFGPPSLFNTTRAFGNLTLPYLISLINAKASVIFNRVTFLSRQVQKSFELGFIVSVPRTMNRKDEGNGWRFVVLRNTQQPAEPTVLQGQSTTSPCRSKPRALSVYAWFLPSDSPMARRCRRVTVHVERRKLPYCETTYLSNCNWC